MKLTVSRAYCTLKGLLSAIPDLVVEVICKCTGTLHSTFRKFSCSTVPINPLQYEAIKLTKQVLSSEFTV